MDSLPRNIQLEQFEGQLERLVSKFAMSQDFHVDQLSTYHSVFSLLEQFELRVSNLNAINIQREQELAEANRQLSRSIDREHKSFDDNERLADALRTVIKFLELIGGVRDTHHDREAQLRLVIRFLTDTLNPIATDDLSDIPF